MIFARFSRYSRPWSERRWSTSSSAACWWNRRTTARSPVRAIKKVLLLKPGAGETCSIFGLSVTYTEDKIIEDVDRRGAWWRAAVLLFVPLPTQPRRALHGRGHRLL